MPMVHSSKELENSERGVEPQVGTYVFCNHAHIAEDGVWRWSHDSMPFQQLVGSKAMPVQCTTSTLSIW